MVIRTLSIWLLLITACLGQTKAVIDGPESALPGELVVLNSNNSVGDSHRWIVPEGISTAQAGCDPVKSQVFFATPREGKYKFILIVADKEANIEFDSLTVEIKSVDAPPPPPPVEPPPVDPVDPPPQTGLEQLTKLSRDNSLRLNDAPTREMLAKSLQAVVNDINAKCAARQCPTLATAQRQVQMAIESTLLQRRGSSRDALWLDGWRIPNNSFMQTLKIESSSQYAATVQAIVNGLR
ncbi:hypothetical protein SH449x_000740 [Pirellulaceae bacterium SH449]